ncbi:hypothetical protein FACS1894111_10360 [Clostridia bacterium]|nr:hypothetical protein FACS1894111_10360 [Clostridia bacterium]
MFNRSTLREIAANEISRLLDDTGGRPLNEWLMRDSHEETEKAQSAYLNWFHRFKDLTEANTAYDVVWDLVHTSEQLAMENGIRLGMRLAFEIGGLTDDIN